MAQCWTGCGYVSGDGAARGVQRMRAERVGKVS